MPTSLFVLFLASGAAALALWVEIRFPSLSPSDWRGVGAHLLAAMLVIQLVMPTVGGAVRESGAPGAQPLTALGVALPAITYLFLTALWMLKVVQRMLPGAR